jgi:hypothetical protein
MVRPTIASSLIEYLGGYAMAATIMAMIFELRICRSAVPAGDQRPAAAREVGRVGHRRLRKVRPDDYDLS